MARRIVFNDPVVGAWIRTLGGASYDPEWDHTFGTVDEQYRVLGACMATGYTGAAVFLHFHSRSETWMTRDLIIVTFDWVFRQQGCASALALVDAANDRALDIVKRLGFKIVAPIPDMFASSDGLLLQLRRNDCRWLNLPLRTLRANR